MPTESLYISDRLISAVEKFRPFHDGKDKTWHFYLKIGRAWIALDVRFYDGVYYCSSSDNVVCKIGGNRQTLQENGSHLANWLAALDTWYEEVGRDPLAAQQRVLRDLPLPHRFGLILYEKKGTELV